MTVVLTGGFRRRLIWDSTYNMVHDALASLGWFNPGRDHEPIEMVPKPYDSLEQIPTNTLTLVPEDVNTENIELGSILAEKTTTFWVDFFAEDDTLGVHLIGDIEDILEGRISSIGRTNNWVDIYNYNTAATPSVAFSCEIMNVTTHRGRATSEIWKNAWYGCAFDIIDTYTNELG